MPAPLPHCRVRWAGVLLPISASVPKIANASPAMPTTCSRIGRGVQFLLSDGVGCEVCHGGSEKWLGPHASGKIPHRELVSTYGLYPTDEPVARARLCLTCHLGDETHVITHRIMGAGHPRLPFELQTFTVIEPAHYVIDDVYRRRKAVAQGVQFWAVGQALALQQLVTGLTNRPSREGAFPELVFFDCQACHHSTTSLRWERRTSMGLDPGMPHFNDANGIMLRAIAARLSPADGRGSGERYSRSAPCAERRRRPAGADCAAHRLRPPAAWPRYSARTSFPRATCA